MAKSARKLIFIIPLAASILFSALHFAKFIDTAENRIYDQFLHLKPDIEEHESILLLNVDDLAIAKVGMWPWTRSYMADGLILMKEFDTRYAVFDIEYTEESPLAVNNSLLHEQIPDALWNEFSYIDENVYSLFQAVMEGAIQIDDIPEYLPQFSELTDQSRQFLMEKIQEIAQDNDRYLGEAARYFENALFTVNMLPDIDEDVPEELKEWTDANVALENINDSAGIVPDAVDIRPAIYPILSLARGAGFPNVIIDPDGVRRRVDIVMRHGPAYYPQLAFSALVHWFQYPKITVTEKRIIMEDAVYPDGLTKDVVIPLDDNGHILINWPKKEFDESFRQLSYYYLILHDIQEERLIDNLRIMNDARYLSYYEGDFDLIDAYDYAQTLKQDILQTGDTLSLEEYREVRGFFFDEVGNMLGGNTEDNIQADLTEALSSGELPEEYVEQYTLTQQDVTEVFAATRDIFKNLMQTRDVLAKELPGSLTIIGWTGTATTDRGVNPFDETYDNVGTHAAFINTILADSFLDAFPWWYGVIAAFISSFAVFFIIRKMNSGPSLIFGFGFVILIAGAGIVLFILTQIYFPVLIPFLATAGTFLMLTAIKFMSTAQERTFIRNAFSHYLSTDVINELLSDPEKLSLGGEKKHLTAIFTDVKGFSTISEAMDPTDLVRLLNMYLTDMSNTILELRGTIDKYEGDAIISFFGAPIDYPDHARRACLSAIRMKRVERELNKRIIEEKLSPLPLDTRIGINTGDMVVGNMGTAEKMDYTIMGNAVNLAARLEGVNKQYGSWVLISEATYEAGGNEFVTRRMDRVRVVGINEPVRLFELIEEKKVIDDKIGEGIDLFHKALEIFEEKRWKEAKKVFEQVLTLIPGDGPAKTYAKRCAEYIKKPRPDKWDGVYNLTVK